MTGAGIHQGDLLVVSRAVEARPGHIVIAAVNGEPTVKRLGYTEEGPVLLPENLRYARRHIIDGDDFSIWGVVTHSLRAHE